MDRDVSELSLPDRVVLLGVAALELDDKTPTHAPQVRQCCRAHSERLEDTVVGTLDEATIARSLNELEATGHLSRVDLGETSAVGKGRPAFALDDPATAVLDALASADAALEPAVDAVRANA